MVLRHMTTDSFRPAFHQENNQLALMWGQKSSHTVAGVQTDTVAITINVEGSHKAGTGSAI